MIISEKEQTYMKNKINYWVKKLSSLDNFEKNYLVCSRF